MKQIIKLMKTKIAAHERQLAELEVKLASSEPGTLEVKVNHGGKRFVRHFKGASTYEYLGKTKLDVVKALAQKRYDSDIFKLLKIRRATMQKCIKILEEPKNLPQMKSVYDNLPEDIKQFVQPNIITQEGYIRAWINETYVGNPYPNDKPYYSAKGEHVRSKSEVIIADRLNLADVPYRYEYPYTFERNPIYPDFTVLNKRTLKVFIWEHMGMMDMADYATKAMEKLEMYARYGYFIGKNLILTFETSTKPLDMQYVDSLIKEFVK